MIAARALIAVIHVGLTAIAVAIIAPIAAVAAIIYGATRIFAELSRKIEIAAYYDGDAKARDRDADRARWRSS